MITIDIGNNCTKCAKCEKYLKGLLSKIKNGRLFISVYNPHVDYKAIGLAIDNCENGSLQLNKV